jgi:hypothetical protein
MTQPPIIPGNTQPSGVEIPSPTTGPVKPARPRWVIPVIVGLACLVVATATVAVYAFTRPTSSSPVSDASATHSSSNTNQVECVNVERAYNAWNGALSLPGDAAGVKALRKVEIEVLMDDGKSFLENVQGYSDQRSKELASAVANYNVEISMANVAITLVGKIDNDIASSVVAAIAGVRDSYAAFKSSTCA